MNASLQKTENHLLSPIQKTLVKAINDEKFKTQVEDIFSILNTPANHKDLYDIIKVYEKEYDRETHKDHYKVFHDLKTGAQLLGDKNFLERLQMNTGEVIQSMMTTTFENITQSKSPIELSTSIEKLMENFPHANIQYETEKIENIYTKYYPLFCFFQAITGNRLTDKPDHKFSIMVDEGLISIKYEDQNTNRKFSDKQLSVLNKTNIFDNIDSTNQNGNGSGLQMLKQTIINDYEGSISFENSDSQNGGVVINITMKQVQPSNKPQKSTE